jgi:NAD(P)-dependent dehydrogenase (short-subunit alcohol dehydrogenase family)
MFSNAGVAMQMPFTRVDLTTWEKILSADLYGVVFCVQAVVIFGSPVRELQRLPPPA